MKPLFDPTDDVRQAMLESLGSPPPAQCRSLCLRIRFAGNTQHLWHMRGELMQALALMRGEAWAAGTLARITPLFGEGLPQGIARSMSRGQLRA